MRTRGKKPANDMSIAAKVGVVGDMVDLTILLSSVTWVLNAGERKRTR